WLKSSKFKPSCQADLEDVSSDNVTYSHLPLHVVRLPTYPESKFMRLLAQGCQVLPESEGKLVLGNPRFSPKLNGFWRQHGIPLKVSSGLYSVGIAIHLCQRVHVYGFWPFQLSAEGKAVRYHYYDHLITSRIIHDFSNEFGVLVKLHELGIIKLHVQKCKGNR
ncbi:alpha-2,8-sialyltransferase 8F-like, partial [Diadema setosum]|uniref:alpha-2,8-sialyltransferase 8F-like n=1 Tax=Diadema setosum TaxID=31175 RepID=UPI003B3B3AC4